MIEVLFDQYQRYKKAEEIVNLIRTSNQVFKILEVGANEHRNLESFLPQDDITYLDIYLSEEFINNPKYILGDATDMKFKDNSYDIIIALDVFEHIPKDKRRKFISELNRVAKEAFIILAPFNTPEVHEVEVKMNNYFKSLMGYDHPWLIEHIEYGLPEWQQVVSQLEIENIKYLDSECNNLEIWKELMKCHLLVDYCGQEIDSITEINTFYNQYVYPYDKKGPTYRKILIGSKNQEILSDIKKVFEQYSEASYEQCEQNYTALKDKIKQIYKSKSMLVIKDKKIQTIEEQLELKDNHIKNIEEQLQPKDNHIKNIENQLELKDNHIKNIENQLELKDNHIKNIENQLELKDNHIKNIENQLLDHEGLISINNKQIELKDCHIVNIENQLKVQNEQIKQLRLELELKDNHINNIEKIRDNLQNIIGDAEKEILQLQEVNGHINKELNEIYSTLLGKLIKKIIIKKDNN